MCMCYCICLRNGKGRSFGKIRNRRFFGSRTTSEKALIDRDLLQGHDPDVNVINENDYTGKVKAEGKIGLRHAIISAIQGMTLKQLEALNVDAVINLKNDTKIAGINVFNEEYKLTDDANGLVNKDGYISKEEGLVNKDGYISKEELEKDYIKKEEIKGLEIAGVKLFNEGNYKLTDDAKKLVKKDGVDLSKYIEKETLKGLKIGDVTLFNEEYKLTKEAAGLVNKDGYISKEELEKDYIKKED